MLTSRPLYLTAVQHDSINFARFPVQNKALYHSGPSITHLMTKLPSLSFPALVISNASSASSNLKVCVKSGLRSTRPRATRSIAIGLDMSSSLLNRHNDWVSATARGIWVLTSRHYHIYINISTSSQERDEIEEGQVGKRKSGPSNSPPATPDLNFFRRYPKHGHNNVWRPKARLDINSTGLDGIQTHLDTSLSSRGVHDEIYGSSSTNWGTGLEEEIFGCSERVLRARLIGFLFDLSSVLSSCSLFVLSAVIR